MDLSILGTNPDGGAALSALIFSFLDISFHANHGPSIASSRPFQAVRI